VERKIPERIIVPTDAETANGWDEKALSKYINEQETAQLERLDMSNRQVRPNIQNHRYRPHRWRE